MIQFETQVRDVIQRTYNVKSFRLNVPEEFNYKAGQFFFLTLKIQREEKQKPFSFSSSPTERGYIEFTKKFTGHEFSNHLERLNEGDRVSIRGPTGEFTFEGQYDKIALLAGGIGITPIRSICKVCTDKYQQTDIILLYGNTTEKDIVFKDELKLMQKHNDNFKIIHTLLQPGNDWREYVGYINREMIQKEVADCNERVFYICGPKFFVESMENILSDLHIPKEQTITEHFIGYS